MPCKVESMVFKLTFGILLLNPVNEKARLTLIG
jgi:hypothetical protein